MISQHMEYSEERGTWNLFVDSGYGYEWYFEGTYEQCDEMMWNNVCCENEDYYEEEDYYGE